MENQLIDAEKTLSLLKEESNATIILEKHFGTISKLNGIHGCSENLFSSHPIVFPLFSLFLEYLFSTFSLCIDLSNYENLTLSIVQWLESFTNPDFLQDILHKFYLLEIESKF